MLNRLKKFILVLGDLLCLAGALIIALVLRYPGNLWPSRLAGHLPHFLVIFAFWLIALYINDTYNLNLRWRSRRFLLAAINSAIIAGLLSILYFYLNVRSDIAPKTNLALFSLIFIILFILWRAVYYALIRSLIPASRLALIGSNQRTEQLLQELKDKPGAGYTTALVFRKPEEISGLEKTVQEKGIDAIVIVDDFGEGDKLSDALFSCLKYNVSVYDYPAFYELISGKVPVEAIGPAWFLTNLQEGERNYFNIAKRVVDLFGAAIILLLSLPFWPLIALIIKLESRGPVFFMQERLGRQEKIFRMIKFRTMRQENNAGEPTAQGDKRITRFGAFLRKSRLDEIPQVMNIIRGEMSFIGPRPERPEIVKELEKRIPYYKTRLLIKPGITGWDQISGQYHSPSYEDTLEKLQYDLYYLKHRSFYLDLAITLKTIATMLNRAGR